MRSRIDWTAHYALAPDLIVTQRDPGTVQIGTDEPRQTLIRGVHSDAARQLSDIARAASLADFARQPGLGEFPELLADLASREFIVDTSRSRSHPLCADGDRLAAVHQYGPSRADRILAARADAIIVVEGSGIIATTVCTLLQSAGIGRIHAIGCLVEEVLPRSATDDTGLGPRGRRVRHHVPAPQVRPDLVVFAGATGPAAAKTATLVLSATPHLIVRSTTARTIVGPLVAPGRSCCVNCMRLYQRDMGASWRGIENATAQPPSIPTIAAAAFAAHEVVDLVDGMVQPSSLGATIEYRAGTLLPQRRRWPIHAECECSSLAATRLSVP